MVGAWGPLGKPLAGFLPNAVPAIQRLQGAIFTPWRSVTVTEANTAQSPGFFHRVDCRHGPSRVIAGQPNPEESRPMIAIYITTENMTASQHAEGRKRLRAAGAPEDAMKLHSVFGEEGKLQVFDIWES